MRIIKYGLLFLFLIAELYAQSSVEKKGDKDSVCGYNIKPYNNSSNTLEVSIADTAITKIFVLSVGKDNVVNYNDTVSVIYNGTLAPGCYRILWDCKNTHNEFVEPGCYIVAVNCFRESKNYFIKTFSGQVPVVVVK